MLTRLKVSGFKNLVDVDVRFGPFTCIAGANGTGKSNLFDAIHFLSLLADRPLLEAAMHVRDARGRAGDVRGLFHRVGGSYDDEILFEAEMIVPKEGADDLGQIAKATTTFLKYSLKLAYRGNRGRLGPGALQILEEELTYIKLGDVPKHLQFSHRASTWRASASVPGARRTAPFISTEEDQSVGGVILLHQDGGSRGRQLRMSADGLPRTVLSTVNAAESPTATLARLEMRSWRMLQLEPSSLRQSDSFTSPTSLGSAGANLAATLYHLAEPGQAVSWLPEPGRVYAEVANRISQLIDDVWEVSVDRDEKRELLTLRVGDRNGTIHPAMSLSDGTLRFLALAVLELDPESKGLICLEEPENGIHPKRILAILNLLQDIATDPEEEIGPDNPLRQVIINTHSPGVVGQVPQESLLVCEQREMVRDDQRFKRACFSCLPETWRAKTPENERAVSMGQLLAYLNPTPPLGLDDEHVSEAGMQGRTSGKRRVADRADLHPYLPGLAPRS